jgi:ankyrin repeat protein
MNCVMLLLEANADVNPVSDTQLSPLDLAIERDMKDVVDILQAHGAKTGNELFALSWESEQNPFDI